MVLVVSSSITQPNNIYNDGVAVPAQPEELSTYITCSNMNTTMHCIWSEVNRPAFGMWNNTISVEYCTKKKNKIRVVEHISGPTKTPSNPQFTPIDNQCYPRETKGYRTHKNTHIAHSFDPIAMSYDHCTQHSMREHKWLQERETPSGGPYRGWRLKLLICTIHPYEMRICMAIGRGKSGECVYLFLYIFCCCISGEWNVSVFGCVCLL